MRPLTRSYTTLCARSTRPPSAISTLPVAVSTLPSRLCVTVSAFKVTGAAARGDVAAFCAQAATGRPASNVATTNASRTRRRIAGQPSSR